MSVSRRAGYSAELVNSEAQIPRELWAACFPPHLEGQWWFRLLERSGVEKQFQIFYAVVYLDGRAIGIAPMFTMQLPIEFVVPPAVKPFLTALGRAAPSLSAPRILFIGSPCSDEGHVGIRNGADRQAVLSCVQQFADAQALARNAAMVIWKDFSPAWQADLDALSARFGLFPMTSFPGTIVDIPGGSKADYYAAMRSQRRYKLRKKISQSAKEFDAHVEVVQRPDPATMDRIYELFSNTRDRATTSFERLDRRFFDAAAEEDESWFILLRERGTGTMVAFMLCFDTGDVVVNKFVGFDYSYPRQWFLYFRLFDVAVDWALERGARAVQSGQTCYSAKLSQGHRLVPLTLYGKHRNLFWHWLCCLVVKKIDWGTLDDELAEHVRAHPDAQR